MDQEGGLYNNILLVLTFVKTVLKSYYTIYSIVILICYNYINFLIKENIMLWNNLRSQNEKTGADLQHSNLKQRSEMDLINHDFMSSESELPVLQYTRGGCYEVCEKRHNGGFFEKICKNGCNLIHPNEEEKCQWKCVGAAHYGEDECYRACISRFSEEGIGAYDLMSI